MTDTSPLAEADPTSLDELFDRVNDKLDAGLPETITDEDLIPLVRRLQLDRLRHLEMEEVKRAGGTRTRAAPRPRSSATIAADVDLDSI